jgi:hypothetical protein
VELKGITHIYTFHNNLIVISEPSGIERFFSPPLRTSPMTVISEPSGIQKEMSMIKILFYFLIKE